MDSLDVFVDESGNSGHGMGRYFTIAFVVCPSGLTKKLRRAMRKASKDIKDTHPLKSWKNGEVKAALISKDERRRILSKICKCDLQVYTIVVDKHHLVERMYDNKGASYNFWMKFVIDDIVADHPNLTNLNFFIDRRTIKVGSLNSFEDYITIHLVFEKSLHNLKIFVKYPESHTDYGIQAADFCANAINQFHLSGNHDLIDSIQPSIRYPVQHFPYQSFKS